MLSFALVVSALIVVGFALFLGLVWWGQERIVFQPPGLSGVGDLRPDVRKVHYRAADGQPLFAYVVRPPTRQRPPTGRVLMAFHGNAEIAAWSVPWAREVAASAQETV